MHSVKKTIEVQWLPGHQLLQYYQGIHLIARVGYKSTFFVHFIREVMIFYLPEL